VFCFSIIILLGSCLWEMCGRHNHWKTGADQKHVSQRIWSTEKLLSICCECFIAIMLHIYKYLIISCSHKPIETQL